MPEEITLDQTGPASLDQQHSSAATLAPAFRPFHDRVLLRRLDDSGSNNSMFVTPDTTKTQAQTCEVVAVGPGRTLDSGSLLPLTVRPGSKVYIGKYSGSELKLPALGDDYLIVREEEILGEILS